MNRNEYMLELEAALRRLPKEEREEALSYFREYFEDAGPEKEAEVIEELGDPKAAASQILKDVAIKRLEEPKVAAKKGLSTIWIVILALCAAPLGLPLLLVVFVLGLTAVIVLLAIFLSLFITGVSLAAAGLVSAAAGFYFLPSQAANGIFILGTALCETGIGLFLILGGCAVCKFIFNGLAGQMKKRLAGGKKQ